jgi:hypothetical protein
MPEREKGKMNTDFDLTGSATIPTELAGPLPRRLRATRIGIYMTVAAPVFLAIAVAGGLRGGIQAVQETQDRAALRGDNRETVAEITRTRKGKTTDVVYYAFTVDGRSFVGQAEVPTDLRHDLRSSRFLPIRFLPTDPDVNHPAAWEWSLIFWRPQSTDLVHIPSFSSELQWFLAPLLFGPLGVLFFMELRTDRRLLAEGVPAVGLVTKCTPGTRGGYSMEYEFRTEDGKVTKGSCGGSRKEIGEYVCVLYLPQNPRQNMRYLLSNFRVVQG